jgi:hypothetical protein
MSAEKDVLQMFVKYAEMVNANIQQLDSRIAAIELALQQSPELLPRFLQAAQEVGGGKELPGLPRQLEALRQALARIQG